MENKVYHTFDAFYNSDSRILILGSMPSVKSRELGFYYMHPKNRFWQILSIVFNEYIGKSIDDKKQFLSKHKIALWDVIESCDIDGSSDSSIKNVIVNDIKSILDKTNIKYIYCTGKKAFELYNKYCFNNTKVSAVYLYSPSPANCAISLDKIVENYKVINKK
ncbi:MAG: DNA-deoxyinosine glycosylase [Bacilli bacterium]|nr:DNA-deoxyinosine glycosylase [Bacilli bacterium]